MGTRGGRGKVIGVIVYVNKLFYVKEFWEILSKAELQVFFLFLFALLTDKT